MRRSKQWGKGSTKRKRPTRKLIAVRTSSPNSWHGLTASDLKLSSLVSAVCRGLIENAAQALPPELRGAIASVFYGGGTITVRW